jgi:cobalamin biosynthesis Co2+ chelatase CbiK
MYIVYNIYNSSRFFNTRKQKKNGTFNVSVQTALRLALRVGSQETVVQVVHVVPPPDYKLIYKFH